MQTSTIVNGKRNGTAPMKNALEVGVQIDSSIHAAHPGERLIDLINRVGVKMAKVWSQTIRFGNS